MDPQILITSAIALLVFLLGSWVGNLVTIRVGKVVKISTIIISFGFIALRRFSFIFRDQWEENYPAYAWISLALLFFGVFVLGMIFPINTWFNRFELWFARRITTRGQRAMSGLVVKLGLVSIALGVAVMQVALSIVFGFEEEIQKKVVGFAGHIHIGNLYEEYENEKEPLPRFNDFIWQIRGLEEVKSVQPYAQKPALLRSDLTQEGVFLKGVDSTYDWSFFDGYLKEGRIPDVNQGKRESDEILISRKLQQVLDVELEESIVAYFYEEKIRIRKLKVVGIYETGMEEFDLVRVLCDLRLVQRIWRWEEDQVEGFEVNLQDLESLDPVTETVNYLIPTEYEARPVTSLFPEIFEWVHLQHQNVWFILALMIIISLINMTSVILILILERTKTIGLLKALGMPNFRVRRLFVSNAMWLILIGMALGNAVAMILLYTQDTWGWLQVDQENYFVNIVPVKWTWGWFMIVNFGVFAVCTLFMYLPTRYATQISPVRILRFE